MTILLGKVPFWVDGVDSGLIGGHPVAGFDQHDPKHQDWLLRWAESNVLGGFYETQDIADLLQGRPSGELQEVVRRYRRMKEVLTRKGFLDWLAGQREANGINVSTWWQEAEDRARLMEIAPTI